MRTTRTRLVSVAQSALLAAAILNQGAALFAADDQWPRYAHDGALTGRTPLVGDIVEPRVAWSISLAGSDLEVEFQPRPGRHSVALPGDARLADRTVPLPRPTMRDLDGSGTARPVTESYHQRWATILPDVPGVQRVGWNQTWTTAEICRLELFAYDQGGDAPRRVWQSEPEGTVFMPLCVVYDIDGDGVQEICVALHHRVMIFEGTTGRKETELKFHSSRSYGWFGLADVDSDGQMELVVLADFQSHLDVLEFDPAKPEPDRLRVKWRREIEQAIERRAKWPQVGPRPVIDVTGDGRPEIVINLYSDLDDDQWHVIVLDAATGEQLADFPNRYTHGSADVDGDGTLELFCSESQGVRVASFGHVEIVDLARGVPSVLWSRDGARFGTADLPELGPTWSTGAVMGMRHVLVTDEPSRPAFLVFSWSARVMDGTVGTTADRTMRLTALRHDGADTFVPEWTADGLIGQIKPVAIALGGQGVSALVRMQLPVRTGGTLVGEGAAPVVVGRNRLATGPSAPIAARTGPDGPMRLFVEGAGENMLAIRATGGQGAEIVWQRPGRGVGTGTGPGSLTAVDLDGDGHPEIVTADQTASGAAALTAYRVGGDLVWRHVFDRTPGARPVHNTGALTFWWPGRFRSPDTIDLFVNTRRGLMHSDVGHLLDGRTGREIWSRDRAVVPDAFRWGYAGMPVGVADVTGDRRDELVNLFPVCFWVADGATGEFVAAEELASRRVLPAWAAYGEPMVHDFLGDGSQQVLLDSVYILALLDAHGEPIWHGQRRRDYPTGKADDNFGETTSVKHALVDFDGDGRFEIASGGYGDGVRAIDPRDGTVLWSLKAPKPTVRRCASANIDGNGGDELIYASGNELVAVSGDRHAGRVLWRWQGPASLSMPAIADVDDDRRAEIVVQSADGIVHCLDGPPM